MIVIGVVMIMFRLILGLWTKEKKMTSLFNRYEAPTADGNILASTVEDAITPIVDRWLKLGFSGRDIHNIIHMTVTNIVSEKILLRAVAKKNAERNSQPT